MYNKEWAKEYYLKNKERIKEQSKRWRKENRIRFNELNLNYQKKTNYKDVKTPEQKEIRKEKFKTRYYFPLFKCIKCNFCESPAIEHHHYTKPIKFDKFNYVCSPCHRLQEMKK